MSDYVAPTSWDDLGMDWTDPDPMRAVYYDAVRLAINERYAAAYYGYGALSEVLFRPYCKLNYTNVQLLHDMLLKYNILSTTSPLIIGRYANQEADEDRTQSMFRPMWNRQDIFNSCGLSQIYTPSKYGMDNKNWLIQMYKILNKLQYPQSYWVSALGYSANTNPRNADGRYGTWDEDNSTAFADENYIGRWWSFRIGNNAFFVDTVYKISIRHGDTFQYKIFSDVSNITSTTPDGTWTSISTGVHYISLSAGQAVCATGNGVAYVQENADYPSFKHAHGDSHQNIHGIWYDDVVLVEQSHGSFPNIETWDYVNPYPSGPTLSATIRSSGGSISASINPTPVRYERTVLNGIVYAKVRTQTPQDPNPLLEEFSWLELYSGELDFDASGLLPIELITILPDHPGWVASLHYQVEWQIYNGTAATRFTPDYTQATPVDFKFKDW